MRRGPVGAPWTYPRWIIARNSIQEWTQAHSHSVQIRWRRLGFAEQERFWAIHQNR
ncbi:MAG TPA: hypothetical protein PKY51_10970 [Fimbriimonadaceae bacterium]|nr:hypothetical protein [Fimbriimonadaceae bacterium]